MTVVDVFSHTTGQSPGVCAQSLQLAKRGITNRKRAANQTLYNWLNAESFARAADLIPPQRAQDSFKMLKTP